MSAQNPAWFTSRFAPLIRTNPKAGSLMERARLVEESLRNGREYRGPVVSQVSHGITFDKTGGTIALNTPRTPVPDEYILDSNNIYLTEQFSYDELMRGSNGASTSGNAPAYQTALDNRMEALMKGGEHHGEIQTAYGPGGATQVVTGGDIGVIATVPVAPGTGPNYGSVTHPVVQLSHGSFAHGIWINGTNMLVDILASNGASLVETGVTVEALVDSELCQVRMFKSGSAVPVAAGDRILVAGSYAKSNVGFQGILQNTTTFANISAANNSAWNAVKFNAGGTKMTRARLFALAGKLKQNGAEGTVEFWCHNNVCADLTEELALLQRFGDKDTTRKEVGENEYIVRNGSVAIRVKGWNYAKQGFGMLFTGGDGVKRVGAKDLGLDPTGSTGQILFDVPGFSGKEVRNIGQFASFLDVPYHNGIVYNIKSTFDSISAGDVTL